ncbi:MAG: efflux RND transporter periplasmic adaptor subunit [Bacteroides sp.]|nr:efflux RND transporter periplasmic adaptor subunit [Bacteroides sp.]
MKGARTRAIANYGQAAFLLILSIWTMTGCNKQAGKETEQTTYTVRMLKPEHRTLTTSYAATISGRQDVDVYAQITGKIVKVCIGEGERVKKGQPLFMIDPVPYEAALETARAAVHTAEAQLSTAELDYRGKEELHRAKVVSDVDLQTAENALAEAKAVVEQRLSEMKNAANDLSYTVVRSPSDGVVGMLPYRVGALVSANSEQPLTTVSDNTDMWVYFSMNETSLLTLMQQYGNMSRAIASMPAVRLQLSNGTEYSSAGKIENVSGVVDRQTGSVTLKAVFPNKDGWLFSGSTGNVLLPYEYEACIVVPQASTYELQDKRFAYKVVDGKAIATEIKVLPQSDGKEFIVTDGLEAGDTVVSGGIASLKDGMEIKTRKEE